MTTTPDLTSLSPQERAALKATWRKNKQARLDADPRAYFPWHDIQEWVFDAPDLMPNPVRVILIVGGNRSGKSKLAMGILADILRRKSPINNQLLTTDKYTGDIRVKDDEDPLRVWIVPPTGEKFRNDWVSPADGLGIKHWMGDLYVDHRQTPDYVFYGKVPGLDPYGPDGKYDETKCDHILGKSQDQDLLTFESSEVDVAIFDEEPKNKEIVESTLMRIATSNGVIIFAFTPLQGLSWSYDKWWKPLIKQGKARKVAERRYIHVPADKEMGGIIAVQMGMADNPRARVYAKEVMDDPSRSDAEKAARVFGEYGYVEGALIPALAGIDLVSPNKEHKLYVVDELPPAHDISQWYLVADPNKSYGAILACIDNDGNVFYVAEHLEKDWPNRMHADAFKEMERTYATGKVQRFADPGSAGGQSIIDLEDFGLYFDNVRKGAGSVSRSVKRLRGLAWVDPNHVHPITGEKGAPRLYFYAPGLVASRQEGSVTVIGSQLAEQISQARQKEGAAPDTLDKDSQNLDLFDCARYIADLAMSYGPSDTGKGQRVDRTNRLSYDSKLPGSKDEDTFNPLSALIDVPGYDFSRL